MHKNFEQLDLFGFPVEPPKQAKKKEPVVKEAATILPQEVKPEPLPVPVQQPAQALPATEPAPIPVMVAEPPVGVVATSTVAVKAPKNITVTKTAGKRGRKSFREMDSEADLIEVPAEEILQQKLYYSISEVAGWFKVNTSLLRFWENEFDILQPRKTRKGDRLFRVEDIKNLQLIYFLLRQRKFSIDGAKNYLKNNKREADNQAQLVQSLTKFKSFLLELKSNLAS